MKPRRGGGAGCDNGCGTCEDAPAVLASEPMNHRTQPTAATLPPRAAAVAAPLAPGATVLFAAVALRGSLAIGLLVVALTRVSTSGPLRVAAGR